MIQTDINQIIDHILSTRQISRADQNRLMSLLFDNGLGDQEESGINRIYEALHQGLIRVVD
ncbi:hypothetical protein PN462_17235 [Spirulina sp. CS-785/01]|uniref:hypothetical protein n=1 Tax=Spirulina sp. CS-785/01 TaxID=3021716 RepID=UPI0023301B29|nr:hypothetical protein [Spirulina sp. CS-785/01]MDB9314861.1 hypothetical protein [Spirulina sp. CS-785/01]